MRMQETIGFPTCFSSGQKPSDDLTAVTRSGQSVYMSVYRTKIADRCRSITITWCKNLLLHGLSVSVEGSEGESHYTCKVELKPWYFWRKQGHEHFKLDDTTVDIYWDLKAAKFNGETEPNSNYYVAVVCDEEVVLLLGDLKEKAYRKTGGRPALIDPILVSKKEHIFGKKKFSTRAKLQDKGKFHEISIELKNRNSDSTGSCGNNSSVNGFQPEMEIRIDGSLVIHVKHLQWKFRGNESIHVNKMRIEVYWDVHDWLFSPGLKHALFIFKPRSLSSSTSLSSLSTPSSPPLSSSASTPTSSKTWSSESLSGLTLKNAEEDGDWVEELVGAKCAVGELVPAGVEVQTTVHNWTRQIVSHTHAQYLFISVHNWKFSFPYS